MAFAGKREAELGHFASGGYTSAKAEVVEWLRQRSRPYLFSNTLAPVIAAASLKVFDLIENGDALRKRLSDNADLFRSAPTTTWRRWKKN
ncbi:aminotransferase class I/II-fold pyridoxal phosphate-dependent enzyme [Rhizobium leguminosarum]|nr:aminotransferase class I/II-fold pyridoxal phosphate-dependent enzyme [Rhizobium leguminosarum]